MMSKSIILHTKYLFCVLTIYSDYLTLMICSQSDSDSDMPINVMPRDEFESDNVSNSGPFARYYLSTICYFLDP
jgi:hypothetical protein